MAARQSTTGRTGAPPLSNKKLFNRRARECDEITGTPLRWLEHPVLTARKMADVDRTIHRLWDSPGTALGRSVDVLLPSEHHRIRKGLDDGAFDRAATARESCSLAIHIAKTLHVDVRKADWRQRAADSLQGVIDQLQTLADGFRNATNESGVTP